MTYRKINELRNWSDNPRSIKPERFQELKNRITRFGQFKPVIVTPDGEVLGGNMRLKAMKELGIEDIWVSVVEPKSEAEKIEIALTDNEEMGFYEDQQLISLIEKYKEEIDLSIYSVNLDDPTKLIDLLKKIDEANDNELIYNSKYQVVVECENEIEQQEVFDKLQKTGYTCKVLTL